MAKAFDSTLKQLLADFAGDWVNWIAPSIGIPKGSLIVPFDPELSSVQLAADKVFRLEPPRTGLIHLELQTSWDGTLPERLHTYNTMLWHRYREPVYSIALLLRKDANASAINGLYTTEYEDGFQYRWFKYWVIRVWEHSAEEMMNGGLGSIPLALLSDEAEGHLGEWVHRMDERLKAEKVTAPIRNMLMTSGFILLGMRYNDDVIEEAFKGIHDMEESTTYQFILRKGRQEARQEDILDILRDRFGAVPGEIESGIRACRDLSKLQRTIRSAYRATSLDEFRIE